MQGGRRRFIKYGVAGAMALAGAGLWWRWREGTPPRGFAYTDDTRAVICAVAPALLRGTAGAGRGKEVVAAVEQAVVGLSAAAQSEIQDLLALLALAPARRILAGVKSPWSQAAVSEVEAFLEDWRFSRIALLQQGYAALHDLVLGAWYGNPTAWESIGYPGPPEV